MPSPEDPDVSAGPPLSRFAGLRAPCRVIKPFARSEQIAKMLSSLGICA